MCSFIHMSVSGRKSHHLSKMVKDTKPVSRQRTSRPMPAIASLGPLFFSLCVLSSLSLASLTNALNANIEEPLTYTRLRFDWKYFIPILKPFQKHFKNDELQIQVTVNESQDHRRAGSQVVHKYYLNPDVDVNNITENDLILEALDQLYKNRLFHPYMQNYDRMKDRKRAADPRKVSRARCNRELDYVMEKFEKMVEARLARRDVRGLNPELATYFDSFGTEESGLLLGNFYWIGQWRQCGLRHIFDPRNSSGDRLVSFSGRYCVASIRAPAWKDKIMAKAQQLKNNYFRRPNEFEEYKNFFRLQLGICLPESCDSTILDSRAADIRKLATRNLREPFASYALADLYCLPDESSDLRQIDQSGWLLIAFMALWLTCLALASYADYYDLCRTDELRASNTGPQSASQRFVVSMSVFESYRKLFKISKRPENPNPTDSAEVSLHDLSFLDFMKAVFMPIILVGHCSFISHQYSKIPLDYDLTGHFWYNIQASAPYFVDRYFCITGFITVYVVFSSGRVCKYTAFQWLYSVFHRYWRLAPPYLLLFWFCRSLFQLTYVGPLWDYGTSNTSARTICTQESWLTPLTLTSNLHPLHEECIVPTWYIGSDFQFYLITPFLLLALAKSPLLGWLTVLGLIVTCIAARIQRYLTDPRAQPLELMRPHFDLYMRHNWDMYPTYLFPHYRISSYLVGLLAGHYCYMVRSGQWRSPFYKQSDKGTGRTGDQRRAAQLRAIVAWNILAFSLMLNFTAFIINKLFPTSMEPYAIYFAALAHGNGHVTASLSSAILFVVLALGYWKRAKRLMEHPVWTFLSRINYAVFLIQVEVITWLLNSAEHMPSSMMWEQFRTLGLIFPLVYSLAFVITLLIINPLTRLETEFVGALLAGKHARKGGPASSEASGVLLAADKNAPGQRAELE